jgi:hypothetical protein
MTLAHLKQNRTILPPYIPAMNCGVLRLLSINASALQSSLTPPSAHSSECGNGGLIIHVARRTGFAEAIGASISNLFSFFAEALDFAYVFVDNVGLSQLGTWEACLS